MSSVGRPGWRLESGDSTTNGVNVPMYQCVDVPIEQPNSNEDFIRSYRKVNTIQTNVIIKQPKRYRAGILFMFNIQLNQFGQETGVGVWSRETPRQTRLMYRCTNVLMYQLNSQIRMKILFGAIVSCLLLSRELFVL